MKKLLITFCLMLPVMALYARGIQEDINLSEEKARTSYALGFVLGPDLRGLELDYNAFVRGLQAGIEETDSELSENEAMELVQIALQKAAEKRNEENRAKEADFFTENSARPGVRTTLSGLQYEVLVEGDGEKPAADSVVRVHYEGSLVDGTVFDSSYARGESAEIPLDMVIPGWTEGIQLMSVGSKYRFYIPSGLAYGPQGAGPIPPYSPLIFTVELLEMVNSENSEYED
ncbi:peptidyl-prolyl cis-trans isomerase [Spirochaetia bacterium]|nr:peptidyl-prolyl cis-trans isomerase [Spirochaetia bacterium]